MGVGLDHLQGLYANSHDPWGFEHSAYEQAKFKATRAALSRHRYQSAFELGCGNGQLARHMAEIAFRYTGMDAVGKALDAARVAVPTGRFVRGFYPCDLPDDRFDLVILSEILYFLDEASLRHLASDIAGKWPLAEVICVTWLGRSGHDLQGADAVALFTGALDTHGFQCCRQTESYRIDRGLPKGSA
ncbi:methyltransferase [Pseudoruegeria sp. SK021]|nr:methyltransferase [Pseudoruegeria sp. SK021]